MFSRTSWLVVLLIAALAAVHPVVAAPIVTSLETTELTAALSEFNQVAFNATARWQSNQTSNFKMRISNGTSGSPHHLVTGGSGITWNSDGPQAFTVNFDGAVVTFTIVDGANTHTIETSPAETEVNSLMIALRSQAGVGISSEIEVTNLALNGEPLSSPSMYLGSVNSRSFLMVAGIGPSFTLTGNLRISKNGGAGEIPSMVVFAGTAPEPGPTSSSTSTENEELVATPEPGTWLLMVTGMLLAMLGRSQRIHAYVLAVRNR